MVCPAQRPLAAGKSRQTSDDVATAQALVTLPVSLIGYLVACYWLNIQTPDSSLPFGPRPLVFISLMVAIAVLCSWVGALC